MDIREIIQRPEYQFIDTNEHLSGRIMFLNMGGSYAYGTNNAGSDIDIRGCVMPRESDLIGLSRFEQYVDDDTDTTIYALNRLILLLSRGNPNCIELLGCRPDQYAMVTEGGRMLLNNRKLFLSKEGAKSFIGYANELLYRLQHVMARDRMDTKAQEQHIMASCERAMQRFHERYTKLPEGAITLHIGPSPKKNTDEEILMDVSLSDYPLRDYASLWKDMQTLAKKFSTLNHRNRKKDDAHVCKHMMHLVRLYYELLDVLKKGDIVTYREAEHDLLMDIRNGKFMDSNGLVRSEFYDLLEGLKREADYALDNTSLPETPNLNEINDLSVALLRSAIGKESLCAKYLPL